METKTIGVDATHHTVTANNLHRQLDEIITHLQSALAAIVRLNATLAAMDITDSTRPGEQHRPRTGYRFVRGAHSGTYVRDPEGTDPLPFGYSIPSG
ncbi:MAG TPA: hypothetical protein VIG37_16870 [Methylomirabilota bacterium]|jgi:hypothetical protein